MKFYLTISACLCGLILNAGENLLPNGSFDKGEPYPESWERADGLTSFWLTEKGRGEFLSSIPVPTASRFWNGGRCLN